MEAADAFFSGQLVGAATAATFSIWRADLLEASSPFPRFLVSPQIGELIQIKLLTPDPDPVNKQFWIRHSIGTQPLRFFSEASRAREINIPCEHMPISSVYLWVRVSVQFDSYVF